MAQGQTNGACSDGEREEDTGKTKIQKGGRAEKRLRDVKGNKDEGG